MLKKLLELIFPPKCAFCHRLLEGDEENICRECCRTLPFTGAKAEFKGEFFDACFAPLYYRGTVRTAVLRFKFRRGKHLARCFAGLMEDCLRDNMPCAPDVITWVPVSAKRLKKRGYDQSRLLAEELAERLGMSAVPCLERKRDTVAQSSLKGEEKRRANVLDAFAVSSADTVAGRRILLVDDVVTTGSTLAECSRELLMAGADRVFCLTLARRA
ncbi:MAG: ComF family protein [Oscillospiraceae bacterium]|nr:ComF family protein [Oscillospiraceae bacterium]